MATGVSEERENPYSGACGSYAEWREGRLIRRHDAERGLSPHAQNVHAKFRSHVADSDFPCLGAKAALNDYCYRYGFYESMNSPDATVGLAHDLWEYVQERLWRDTNYATFVACFEKPSASDELGWEKLLWDQMQRLHLLDRGHYDWDSAVSSNPEDGNFSFSFAGTGFFVVGLHGAASRIARRFPFETLVFNTHAQFEKLREENQYDRLQQTIRSRDLKLQGTLNPNLSNFGEESEARQYSGRAVEKDWKCPFHALLRKKKD